MSEFNAAFGLLQLKYVDKAIALRAKIDDRYRTELADVSGVSIPAPSAETQHNYSYFRFN